MTPGRKATGWCCWSAMSPITAAWASRRCRRAGRPCPGRSITTACWWSNSWPAPSRACRARFARTGNSRAEPSELLRDADEITAPRPELRREHADAGAIADFIDLVEDVDDIEA